MPISLILIPHKTEYKNTGKMRKTKKTETSGLWGPAE